MEMVITAGLVGRDDGAPDIQNKPHLRYEIRQ